MPTMIHRRVEDARAGANPTVIARLRSGWAVMGDHQVVPGYCLLLGDPVVPSINSLSAGSRRQFMDDMLGLGDALLGVTEAARINTELLGNSVPALHAHVTPRYDWEPKELRGGPTWFYDRAAAVRFDADRDAGFMAQVRAQLLGAGLVTDPSSC